MDCTYQARFNLWQAHNSAPAYFDHGYINCATKINTKRMASFAKFF